MATAHLARWLRPDGEACWASLTPYEPRFVAGVEALPRACRRWCEPLKVWLVDLGCEVELRELITGVFGEKLCPRCMRGGDFCADWLTLHRRGQRLGLGGLADHHWAPTIAGKVAASAKLEAAPPTTAGSKAAAPIANVAVIAVVRLDLLRLDGGTQSREAINHTTVDEYAAAMAAAAVFPPVVAFFDGTSYWLADGFHRVLAAAAAHLDEIVADVRAGTQQDAAWYAASANATHGLRRTSADRRQAVAMALRSQQARGLSDRAIAEHVGVSDKTVAGVRAELEATAEIPQLDARTGKDGRTRNTSSAKRSEAVRARLEPEKPPPAPTVAPAPAAPPLALYLFEPEASRPRNRRRPTLRRALAGVLALSEREQRQLLRQVSSRIKRDPKRWLP